MFKSNNKQIVVILNNIRSSENVGSIFRTADAVGVSKVIIVGITPAPIDRFDRENKRLTKSSLGAEKSVSWGKAETLKEVVEKLRKENFKIIAVEQNKESTDFKNYKLSYNDYKLAFVFGNEVSGLSEKDLSLCDKIIEIPMKGRKESLNVSVTVGIIIFCIQ